MSEPIIIETTTTTRERLVLVPVGETHAHCRDATPDDLERAGWVPSVGDGSFAAVCDVIQRAHRVMHTEPGSDLVRECARVWREGREAVERAEKAERERDDLLARINQAEEAARALRAELARLTALDRATDDELVDLYRKIYETHGGGTISVSHDDCRRAGVRAVAARVRQERCLVAQAVAMRAGVTISRTSERVPGTTGMWDVYVTRRPDVPGEHYAYSVPTADVPATLARLLGEVAK